MRAPWRRSTSSISVEADRTLDRTLSEEEILEKLLALNLEMVN